MFAKSDAARGPSPPKPRRFIRSGGFAFRQRDGGRLLRLGDGPIPPWPVVLNRSGLATQSVPAERLAVACWLRHAALKLVVLYSPNHRQRPCARRRWPRDRSRSRLRREARVMPASSEEFREVARECVRWADETKSERHRQLLLETAQTWFQAALELEHRLPRNRRGRRRLSIRLPPWGPLISLSAAHAANARARAAAAA
jgi:hypothetical protein